MADEGKTRGKVPPPYALAMLVCDGIHRDPGTGKHFILGTFSAILAREFPAVHPFLAVYVALVDGRGKVALSLRVVDVDEADAAVAETEVDVEFQDPRVIVEISFGMVNVVFPKAGHYLIQLHANGQHVIERRLLVQAAEDRSGQETEG